MAGFSIVNMPNKIRQKQIMYQNDPRPTYMKGNGKYYFPAYMVLFTVSCVGSYYQLFQFIRGKAPKKGE